MYKVSVVPTSAAVPLPDTVIPAQAGIQRMAHTTLDPRLRGDDDSAREDDQISRWNNRRYAHNQRRSWIMRTMLTATLALGLSACGTPDGPAVRVVIPIGTSFRAATDSLASAGIISRPQLFRMYARIQGLDRRIHPGTYLLQRGTPWNGVIAALSDGQNAINRVTIPEGFSLAQITTLLAEHLQVPAESLDAAVRDTVTRALLQIPTPTLEGYLFPDTYVFPPGTTARQAVSEMVKRFEREWKPEYTTQLAQLKMNRHQLITLASIVEKEAKIAEERPVIAAVYQNRLKINMPLQADPTVQYALGRHVARVTFDDLKTDSPYNTYLYPGLPPGPIASPGAASIRAALQPANVEYLYFVAAPDGHHEFRMTLEEHTNAIRAIRGSTDTPQSKQDAKPNTKKQNASPRKSSSKAR